MRVEAELTGSLWKLVAKPGQEVKGGDTLMILESMKMEIPVTAPGDGKVSAIHVKEGDTVQEGQLLAEIE